MIAFWIGGDRTARKGCIFMGPQLRSTTGKDAKLTSPPQLCQVVGGGQTTDVVGSPGDQLLFKCSSFADMEKHFLEGQDTKESEHVMNSHKSAPLSPAKEG